MLAFFTDSGAKKNKKPPSRLLKNSSDLFKLLNENLVHVLNEKYPENKSVLPTDAQLTIQMLLLLVSAVSFYLTKKYEFEESVSVQWMLVTFYFAASAFLYLYERYVYYFVDQKSVLVYRNEEEKMALLAKLAYEPKQKGWPSHYVVNNTTRIPFSEIVDGDFSHVDYDSFRKIILERVVEKKKQ